MANTFTVNETEKAQPVLLAPVHSSYFNSISTEPQMIMERKPNNAYLYTSSDDVKNRDEPATLCATATEGTGTLMRKVKRMGLTFMKFNHTTSTINDTNHLFQIYKVSDNKVYDVRVSNGNWNTPQKLMTAFAAALTSSGIPGIDDTKIYFAGNTGLSSIIDVQSNTECVIVFPFDVYILSQSPGIIRGRSTFAFPVVKVPENWNGINPVNQTFDGVTLTKKYTDASYSLIKTGSMPCRYSRFLDIYAPSLTGWTKLPNASTKSGSSTLLYRLYLDEFNDYKTTIPDAGIIVNVGPVVSPEQANTPIIFEPTVSVFNSNIANPITFTRNVDESISVIDIEIRDEYGNEFTSTHPEVYSFTDPLNPSGTTIIKSQTPTVFNWGIRWDLVFYNEI